MSAQTLQKTASDLVIFSVVVGLLLLLMFL